MQSGMYCIFLLPHPFQLFSAILGDYLACGTQFTVVSRPREESSNLETRFQSSRHIRCDMFFLLAELLQAPASWDRTEASSLLSKRKWPLVLEGTSAGIINVGATYAATGFHASYCRRIDRSLKIPTLHLYVMCMSSKRFVVLVDKVAFSFM